MMIDVKEMLNDKGIKLRSYNPGGRYKTVCPECSSTRRKKGDPCLSVTIDEDGMGAIYNCHHCGHAGNVTGSKRVNSAPRKNTVVPVLKNKDSVRTVKLDADLSTFFNGRGISDEVVERNRIVTAVEWMPKAGAEVKAIVFPYMLDGQALNFKFRSKGKDFKQSKDALKILFGMDDVPQDAKELIIVEGELDKMSLNEAGIWNAVSIPDGAISKAADKDDLGRYDNKFEYIVNCEDFLNSFTSFVIATDGDAPGIATRDELARRLGKEKCSFINYPDNVKDFNDILLAEGTQGVHELLASAYPCPVGDLFAPNDFHEQVMDLYDGKQERGLSTGWVNLDSLLSWYKKMLCIVTGSPGSGKSEWVDAQLKKLCKDDGWKVAYASLENSPARHIHKLASNYLEAQTTGDYKVDPARFKEALDWVNNHYKFIYPQGQESPTIDWVLDKARAAVMRDGIDALVIDPYNCFEHNVKTGQSETNYISSMLTKVKLFAEYNDVLVFFIAHPAKMSRDKAGRPLKPTLNDISGSNAWWSKADYGVVLHRERGEDGQRSTSVEVHVQKVRFQPDMGSEGMVHLNYIPTQSRYVEDYPLDDYTSG